MPQATRLQRSMALTYYINFNKQAFQGNERELDFQNLFFDYLM